VESLEGRTLLSTFTVQQLDDDGPGSLRQAIIDANAAPGPDVIAFDVTGTIRLTSGALPAITDPVDIDGTTAPGFAGTPLVEVDANGFDGLRFAARARGSTLRSLAIVNAGGHGVTLDAGRMRVLGNHIGVRTDGVTAAGNAGDGIRVNATSSRNVIGGPTTVEARNVISANSGDGIGLHGSSRNQIVANFIGTDATGTLGLGNAGNGIRLSRGASFNRIGGNTPLPAPPTGQGETDNGKPVDGNVISGNGQNGVLTTRGAGFNRLSGNFIGTDLAGTAAIGNALDGVAIVEAHNNQLLGTFQTSRPLDTSNAFVFYNVVSGNGGNGLRITDARNTLVWANFFGLGANNQTPLGNGLNGTVIEGTSTNTRFGGIIPFGNVAAANGQNGLEIRDAARGTTVGNTFAGLAAFDPDPEVGNAEDGIHITSRGGNTFVLTNVLAGNADDGIELSGNARGVNLVQAFAGLNTVGTTPKPNGGNGVEIGGNARDNLIGGFTPSVIPQSTFSGNRGYGLAILGNARRNRVINAFIGTSGGGRTAIPNEAGGILIGGQAHNNVIGGLARRDRLFVGGNNGPGIELAEGARRNWVVGNTLGGLNRPAFEFGNDGDGIALQAGTRQNTIAFNTASLNLANGFAARSGAQNRFLHNVAERNQGYGFFVDAIGSDSFLANRCADNGLGGSNVPGIC